MSGLRYLAISVISITIICYSLLSPNLKKIHQRDSDEPALRQSSSFHGYTHNRNVLVRSDALDLAYRNQNTISTLFAHENSFYDIHKNDSSVISKEQIFRSGFEPTIMTSLSADYEMLLFKKAMRSKRVFYNRVPKCGSEGVVHFIRVLARVNHFSVNRSHVFRERFLSREDQEEMVAGIQALQPPVVFDRHVYFTNFSQFNEQMPVYINVIRDPVERFISAYYYNKKFCHSDICLNETLEKCLSLYTYRCNIEMTKPDKNRMWITIPFFCGHHELCRTPSRAALELAKRNTEESYLVVGILEELERFYYVLDYAMPHFFSGIHSVYLKNLRKDKHIKHSTAHKPVTSEYAKGVIRNQLHLEYEFYEFVNQLLNKRMHFIDRFIKPMNIQGVT